MLNTGIHMTDDQAHEIARTIHSNWDLLKADLPQLAGMSAADFAPSDNMHPYHPGAVRYFREAGLWTAAHEANQIELLSLATAQ